MGLPRLKGEPYGIGLLDLPRRNLLIFVASLIGAICLWGTYLYADNVYPPYPEHGLAPMLFSLFGRDLPPGLIDRICCMADNPSWVRFVVSYGFLLFIVEVAFVIVSIVQFRKLRSSWTTEFCMLKLLEKIDLKLGIYYSGNPKVSATDSRFDFYEGWESSLPGNCQLRKFGLQMDCLQSGSEDWRVWIERSRLLIYYPGINDTRVRGSNNMALLSATKAKEAYVKIKSIDNEEYPGEYQSHLEFIDDFIKSAKEEAR